MKQQKQTRLDILHAVSTADTLTVDLLTQARKQTNIDNLTAKQRRIYTMLVLALTDEKKPDFSKNLSVSQIKSSIEKELLVNSRERGYAKTTEIVSDNDIFRVIRYTYGLVFGNYIDFAFLLSLPKNAKSFQSASIRCISSEQVHTITREKIILEEVKADTTKAVQSA